MLGIVAAACLLAIGCRSAPTAAPRSTPAPHAEPAEAALPSHDPAAPSDPEPEPPAEASASPYADLPPPPGQAAKEAYGSPDGWDPTRPSGDSWAGEIMMALNTLDFPDASDQVAEVRFTLRVCKDGSIHPELFGDAPATPLEEQALAELRSLKVPAPPPEIRAQMRSDCGRVKYVFQWTHRGIR